MKKIFYSVLLVSFFGISCSAPDKKKTEEPTTKSVATTTPAINVSTTTTEPGKASDLLQGTWVCSNIYGGKPEDEVTATDLEVLQTNFIIEFGDDASLSAKWVNPEDVNKPMDMKGVYTIENNKIKFRNLIVDGVQLDEDQVFVLAVNSNELKLIIEETGEKDFVMSFEKAP